ncbi:MAG: hypothetical protein ACD_62C00593G0002 [uncultured bacterium]|nr:MAG: hypothetical protein ACD_62C00593G0002 [uncultured bacterium]HLD45409.1 hypothetical protein [bacterium]
MNRYFPLVCLVAVGVLLTAGKKKDPKEYVFCPDHSQIETLDYPAGGKQQFCIDKQTGFKKVTAGDCQVRFPTLPDSVWHPAVK